MENIEKLPILKTAWVANKQFFKQFLNLRTLLTFMLPLMVVFGFENITNINLTSLGQEIEVLERMGGSSDELALLQAKYLEDFWVYLPVFLLYLVFAVYLPLCWHRNLILEESLSLNPVGKLKVFGRYIRKFIWYSLTAIAVMLPFIVVITAGFTFYSYLLPTIGGLGIVSGLLMFVIAIAVAWVWLKAIIAIISFSLSLPAAAVGVNLTLREAYRVSKLFAGRLFVSQFILGCMIGIAGLCAIALGSLLMVSLGLVGDSADSLFSIDSIALIAIAGFFVLWYLAAPIGVLSMFYMHYIVPQLPAIEKAREEKSLEKSEGNKPSSDE